MRSLTKFGTYGFLSALMAAQVGMTSLGASEAAVKADGAIVNAKKSGRSFRRDVKKTGRKITGQENKYDDFKDSAKDSVQNTKDEINHQKKKAE